MATANNSSIEILTFKNEDFEEKQNDLSPNKVSEKQTNIFSDFSQNLRNKIDVFFLNHTKLTNITKNVFINIIIIVYFAFATKYYIDQDYNTIDFCNGFGMVILIFTVINLFLFKFYVYEPYLSGPLHEIIDPIDLIIERFFDKKFVTAGFYFLIFAVILIFLVVDCWESPNRLIALGGFYLMLLFGFVFSKHPGEIKARPIVCGMLIQFAVGLFTIRWEVGRNIFECIGDKVITFLKYTDTGSSFVYGELLISQNIFAFEALSVIFFLSFMVHILYYYGIVQNVVVALGVVLQKLLGTTICESVNAAANIFLGMTESPILLQPYLQDLTLSELHAVMTAGFAAVSGTVLAAYINFGASAAHLITASVMSAPAGLCFAKLFYPETEETKSTKETIVIPKKGDSSVLDAACKGASMGVEIVLGIIGTVIAFVTFVGFLNGVINWFGVQIGQNNWSIEELFSYIFMPLSFVMGVPWDECQMVGKLIGIKTIINEFSAYKLLGEWKVAKLISKRSEAIATYAVCGFSNPGSVGMMISTMSALIPGKRTEITALVFRSFLAGAVVCFMTACIAGMLISEDGL